MLINFQLSVIDFQTGISRNMRHELPISFLFSFASLCSPKMEIGQTFGILSEFLGYHSCPHLVLLSFLVQIRDST